MSFEEIVNRAAKATVIVRATNNPKKENSFTTGFVVGHCRGLCIIMTVGHYLAPGSDQMLEVIFFGHPDEVFVATVQLHLPESEILILTVKKRDEIETGRLIFESEDGWELRYLQMLVSVSHPCSLRWRAALGIINCPEFVNTAIEQYDNQMILFDHSLQLAVGSSGAALINEHGKIVGIQSGEISSTYLAMSGQPVSDALDMLRTHTHDLPFGLFALYIADLVYGYQQLHEIKTILCSLKQAVHIKYIDKVLRSFIQEHFIRDISKVGLNDLLEQYISINPSVGSFKRNLQVSGTSFSHPPYSVVPSQPTCTRTSSQLTCSCPFSHAFDHPEGHLYDIILQGAAKVDETVLISEHVPESTHLYDIILQGAAKVDETILISEQ